MRPEMFATRFSAAPRSLRLATAVAGFAEILRHSPHAKNWSLGTVSDIAQAASWGKPEQRELLQLISLAKRLRPQSRSQSKAQSRSQPLVLAN
jgi:Ca-activated chloride channel family protein